MSLCRTIWSIMVRISPNFRSPCMKSSAHRDLFVSLLVLPQVKRFSTAPKSGITCQIYKEYGFLIVRRFLSDWFKDMLYKYVSGNKQTIYKCKYEKCWRSNPFQGCATPIGSCREKSFAKIATAPRSRDPHKVEIHTKYRPSTHSATKVIK